MKMTAEAQLIKLVDLALCGPDVGAVNFRHLRTLLLEILKISFINGKISDPTVHAQKFNVESENRCAEENTLFHDIATESADLESFQECFEQQISSNNIKRLLENQKSLEYRISILEKDANIFESFPLNNIIFKNKEDSSLITISHNLSCQNSIHSESLNSPQDSNNGSGMLGSAWKLIKVSRRLQVAEEGIDKLFSLMNEILEQHKFTKDILDSTNGLHNQINQISGNIELKIKQLENVIEERHDNENWMKFTKELDLIDNRFNLIDNTFNNELSKIQEEIKSNHKSCFGNLNKSEIQFLTENMQQFHKASAVFDDITKINNDLKKASEKLDDIEILKSDINEIKSVIKCGNIIESEAAEQLKQSEFIKQASSINQKLEFQKSSCLLDAEAKLDDMKVEESILNSNSNDILVAIQTQIQKNCSDILSLQESLKVIQKVYSSQDFSLNNLEEINSDNSNQLHRILKSNFLLFQEEQNKLFVNTENFYKEVREELMHKQKEINALHEQIHKLQNTSFPNENTNSRSNNQYIESQAENENRRSGMSNGTVPNDKSDFHIIEERYQILDGVLQDALQRIDTYAEHEATLEEALNKLTEDLNCKMDSGTEKKLRKFLEERLKEIQKTCISFLDESGSDMRNAAGLRKPIGSYHCISCDRSIDVSTSGFMPTIPQKFPSKKTLAPYTSYELDHLRQQKFSTNQFSYDMCNRSCGGQHTIVNSSIYRTQKGLPVLTADEVLSRDIIVDSKEYSIGDCVVGTDGHIYRGKYQQVTFPPTYPKKIPYSRSKHGSPPQRMSYSATAFNQKLGAVPKIDEAIRPHSADFAKSQTISPVLPPIIRDHSPTEDCNTEVF